jgi:tRNA(Ile)-lysidine synthase
MQMHDDERVAIDSELSKPCSPDTPGVGPAAGALPFERQLAAEWPVAEWRDTHVVLAVSGGADSVALMRAMIALKATRNGTGRLYVAHLNHCLRGAEADADAAWLEAECRGLALPLEIAKADIASLAAEQGDGWEAAARTARYDFLRHVAERLGARFVATAHTADDQVETVLQRIVRGTGLAGLAGIPSRRRLSHSVILARPMLALRRSDVLSYLATIGQEFRTDSTNTDARFARNRLRHDLLPLLRERFNNDVDAALLRLACQAGEAQDVLENLAAEIARDCVVIELDAEPAAAAFELRPARRVRIDCAWLATEPAIVVGEVCKAAWRDAHWPLRSMGFQEWKTLASLASGAGLLSHANLPAGIEARRDCQHLILESRGLP